MTPVPAPAASLPSVPAPAPLPKEGQLQQWVEAFMHRISSTEDRQRALDRYATLDLPEYYQKYTLDGEEECALILPAGPAEDEELKITFLCKDFNSDVCEWLRHVAYYTDAPEDALRLYAAWRSEWREQASLPSPRKRVRRGDLTRQVRKDGAAEATPLNTDETFRRMFVYCSIIEATIMSDIKSRVLRIVHVEEGQARYTFRIVFYLPVQYSTFQTIEITLADKFGNHWPMQPSVNPTTLYLHFVRAGD